MGQEDADCKMLFMPARTSGMTALGSSLKVMFEATWAMPETPEILC